ncbi:MAG: HlyD family secretion protein, partial [Thermoanaerobaculia bacterium]
MRWVAVAAALLLLLVIFSALRGRKVPAARVERRAIIETLVVNGRVLARSMAEVGSPIAGTVSEIRVQEGDRVKKGQLLVSLVGSEEQANAQQARDALRQAEAQLATLAGTSARGNREALEQARLRQAEADHELVRLTALAKSGLIAQADLDSSRRRAGIARSEVEAAAAADRSTSRDGSAYAAAVSNVAQQRAALASAEARLQQTRITAPADGTVLSRGVEPGVALAPGRTVVVMTLDSEVLLLAQPDEKSLRSLAAGQRARVSADAFPDR